MAPKIYTECLLYDELNKDPNMSDITTDPLDPRLTRGEDKEKVGQAEAYLVKPQLPEEYREKSFVRPVRQEYVHMGIDPVVDGPIIVKYGVGGCGAFTRMSKEIAETYASDNKFYSHTYCVGCRKHLSVKEFWWDNDFNEATRVVGS